MVTDKIERLARKLYPLMPKQVDRWMRLRETDDAEVRSLVERQIQIAVRKRLGDHQDKPLLSLPPQRVARGELNLGTVVYEQDKWPLGLSRGELLQHAAIYGRSGSGKTTTAFHLLEQLSRKSIPFLFLDWKRTGRDLLTLLRGSTCVYTSGRSVAPFPFNPFLVPPGLEEHVYIGHIVDLMGQAFTLGDGAKSLLQRVLSKFHRDHRRAPTGKEILEAVEAEPATERARGWKMSAVRALQSLQHTQAVEEGGGSQQQFMEDLLGGGTFVEMDSLPRGARVFLSSALCLWLYYVQLASRRRETLDLVIFLEEAHQLLGSHERRAVEPVMEMLLRQSREVGIAFVVIDQHVHLIPSAARGNTFTSIVMSQKDPRDVRAAAELSGLDETDRRHLQALPVGHAVVRLADRWRHPVLVRVPKVNIDKGSVSDEELAGLMANRRSRSGRRPRVSADHRTFRGIPDGDEGLTGEDFAFIEDVLRHPDDGVRQRLKRLGYGGSRGHRIKEKLLQAGWLEAEVITVGKTRKLLLRLNASAGEMLGLNNRPATRASMAHEYWKRFYAKQLAEQGYTVETEAPLGGGYIDVLATRNGDRIAIEIETGQSDVVNNVRKCLKAGLDRVIVVATNAPAKKRVLQRLGRSGLLISRRTMVVDDNGYHRPGIDE